MMKLQALINKLTRRRRRDRARREIWNEQPQAWRLIW